MRRVGRGEHAVLCLHGWFGSARGWGYLPEVVDTEAFTYLFPEMRGYGARRAFAGDFTMWEYASDALAAADEAGLERFSVLGHSMGGKAATVVAAQAPERVRALVGVSAVWPGATPMPPPQQELFHGAATDPGKRYGIIDATTGNRLSPHWIRAMVEDSLARSTAQAVAGAMRSWTGDDLIERIGTIEVPTLLVCGGDDPGLSAEQARRTWPAIAPKVRVVEIPGVGHYAPHEAPLALVSEVESFLLAH